MNRRAFLHRLAGVALAMGIGMRLKIEVQRERPVWFRTKRERPALLGATEYLAIGNDGAILVRPIAEHPNFDRLKQQYGWDSTARRFPAFAS
jgi:hypothetical protein